MNKIMMKNVNCKLVNFVILIDFTSISSQFSLIRNLSSKLAPSSNYQTAEDYCRQSLLLIKKYKEV